MNRHQVCHAPGFWKLPLRDLFERTDVVHTPVSPCSNLTQLAPEFGKHRIPFTVRPPIQGQDLIDLREHNHGATAIELRRQEEPSVSRQARQANQGRSLLVDE